MSRVIRIDNGVLSLGDEPMPGVISSLSVGGKMIIDQAQVEGSSGKKKSFSGYDDASISIGLILAETTDGRNNRYGKLKIISNAFKAMESGAPIVYQVQGAVFEATQIRHVLFVALDTDDPSDSDSLHLTLKFAEHDPMVALVQGQQDSQGTESASVGELQDNQIYGMSGDELKQFRELEASYE